MPAFVWVCVVLTVGIYLCTPIADPDLWWHITIGRWIVSHRSIPSVDLWTLYGSGKPWRAYSWSNEIAFSLVDGAFGIRGLLVFQLFLGVLLAASLAYYFSKLANDWFAGSAFGLFAATSSFNHLTLRPQLIIWILFPALIFTADEIDRRGFSRGRILMLAGLMMVWANTHLSAALGVGLVFCWLFRSDAPRVAVQGAAWAFLGTLLTPYLGGEWITFASKTGHPFALSKIAEFQPATIMQYSTAFVVIGAATLMSFLYYAPRSVSVMKLLCALGYMVGSLAVVKFIPFSVMVMAAVCCRMWREAGPAGLGNTAIGIDELRKLWERIPREGLCFLLLCISIVNGVKLWNYPMSLDVVPKEAMDFIIERRLSHPILNEFGAGGYVMYRLSDDAGNLEHLVPIDGRTNVTPHEVWKEYDDALSGHHGWRKYIDRVKPQTILWRMASPFTTILMAGSEWCLVYMSGDTLEDGHGVFVRADEFRSRGDMRSPNCEGGADLPSPAAGESTERGPTRED